MSRHRDVRNRAYSYEEDCGSRPLLRFHRLPERRPNLRGWSLTGPSRSVCADDDYDDDEYYEPNSPNSSTFSRHGAPHTETLSFSLPLCTADEHIYRRDSPSHTQSVFSFVEQQPSASSEEVGDAGAWGELSLSVQVHEI
jgi:hypothetical protein